MKKEDLILPMDVSHAIFKTQEGKMIKDMDISELIGLGFQPKMDMDSWLDLISEGKKVKEGLRVVMNEETFITIKTVQALTNYDYWQVLYYGVATIVSKLIDTGKLKDLDEFREQRGKIRKTYS